MLVFERADLLRWAAHLAHRLAKSGSLYFDTLELGLAMGARGARCISASETIDSEGVPILFIDSNSLS